MPPDRLEAPQVGPSLDDQGGEGVPEVVEAYTEDSGLSRARSYSRMTRSLRSLRVPSWKGKTRPSGGGVHAPAPCLEDGKDVFGDGDRTPAKGGFELGQAQKLCRERKRIICYTQVAGFPHPRAKISSLII